MNARLTVLTKTLCLWVCLLGYAFGQAPNETRTEQNVAAGLTLTEIKRGDFTAAQGDRWTIQVLTIDPARFRLQLGLAMDEIAGSELTSSLAARHGALAAVNGGYFRTTGIYRGEQMGALFVKGKLLSEPIKQRAALAVGAQGELALANVSAQATLLVNGKSGLQISGFNRPRENDELIVFTPEFHRTTLTATDGLEIIVRGERVVSLHDQRGSQSIPADGLVLSAHGKAREWALANLKQGVRVSLKVKTTAQPAWSFQPEFVLGAGPRLLANGQNVFAAEAENYSTSLYQQRHPRTAIGWRSDKTILLVVVDGRQPKISVGMTMVELAELMRSLGCVDAMNLDGGGSSTMVVKQKILNHPSDATGERAVSDALLVVPR